MPFLSLDTCVWLGLIKIDLNKEDSVFEEVCYWIENKHIVHIVPANIIEEWNNNMLDKARAIINDIRGALNRDVGAFKGNTDMMSAYQPDVVNDKVNSRIKRVDDILKKYSKVANENDTIYLEAAKRNLTRMAPNNVKDSFRDTVNILTLIHYLNENEHDGCFFSTINYKDFSSKDDRGTIHSELSDSFTSAKLTYVYCDEEPFAGRLMARLRPLLPKFQDHLKERKRLAEEKALLERKAVTEIAEDTDRDFLENIRHLDIILEKSAPTDAEKEMLKSLMDRHPSYKRYFFDRLGNNGDV
jgi:hypothetical protein